MMRGMYAAISGLEVHQTMLDVTANNLANVDTIGYKAQRVTFVDQLAQTLSGGSAINTRSGGTNPMQIGLGVQLGSIDNLMAMGSLQSTSNPLDVAIQGNGFIRVGSSTPPAVPTSFQYTRAGDLTLDPNGYLMTQGGIYLVGKNATSSGSGSSITYSPGTTDSLIKVPPGSTDVSIGQDGSVSYLDQTSASPTFGQRVTAGYVALATFSNPAGLQRDGQSLWSPTTNSGTAKVGTPDTSGFGQTVSGALEMSNVDIATEFTNMITAQRGYEANSKVITTADQMLQTVTQMKQ